MLSFDHFLHTSTSLQIVLFADLKGSTSLYKKLGNAEAASVVTQSISLLGQVVESYDGRVIKTLGDGLMAVFSDANQAMSAATEMHDALERISTAERGGPVLTLKVGASYGELVDVDGDCYGDAVNIAARVLELATDRETLFTQELVRQLSDTHRARFRDLDQVHLRGHTQPVRLFRMEVTHHDDALSTVLDAAGLQNASGPGGILICWANQREIFSVSHLPVIIGRSLEANFNVHDKRVSRLHARIDWNGSNFQITDLSSNGTVLSYDGDIKTIVLRRSSCTLHGSGKIWLGHSVQDEQESTPPYVLFETLSQTPETAPTHL